MKKDKFAREWAADAVGSPYVIIEIPPEVRSRGEEIDFIIKYVSDNLNEYGEQSPRKVIYFFEDGSDEEGEIRNVLDLFVDELRAICEERGIQPGQQLDRSTLRAISKRVRWYLITFTPYWFNVTIVPEGQAELSWFEECWERKIGQGELSLD